MPRLGNTRQQKKREGQLKNIPRIPELAWGLVSGALDEENVLSSAK